MNTQRGATDMTAETATHADAESTEHDETLEAGAGQEAVDTATVESTSDVNDDEAPDAARDDVATDADDVDSEDMDDDADEEDEEERLVEEGEIAGDYLEQLLDVLDFDGDIDLDVDGDRAIVSIDGGDDLTKLVGRKGEVLDALQELTRLAVQQATGDRSRLMLDIARWRADRRERLARLGREVAEQVGLGAARGIAVGGGAGQGAAAVGVLPVVLRQDDRADRQVP